MAKSSYEVANLSYLDTSRNKDYLVELNDGRNQFHMPTHIPNFQYVYAGSETEFTCQASLEDFMTHIVPTEQNDNKNEESQETVPDENSGSSTDN